MKNWFWNAMDYFDNETTTYLKGVFYLSFGFANVIGEFFLRSGLDISMAFYSAFGGLVGIAIKKYRERLAIKRGKKVIILDPFTSLLSMFIGTSLGFIFSNLVQKFWLTDFDQIYIIPFLIGMFWELFYKKIISYLDKKELNIDNEKSTYQTLDDEEGGGTPNQLPPKPKN